MKSLKIDEKALEIVIFRLNRKVADKRNRSEIQKRGCATVNGPRKRWYEPQLSGVALGGGVGHVGLALAGVALGAVPLRHGVSD